MFLQCLLYSNVPLSIALLALPPTMADKFTLSWFLKYFSNFPCHFSFDSGLLVIVFLYFQIFEASPDTFSSWLYDLIYLYWENPLCHDFNYFLFLESSFVDPPDPPLWIFYVHLKRECDTPLLCVIFYKYPSGGTERVAQIFYICTDFHPPSVSCWEKSIKTPNNKSFYFFLWIMFYLCILNFCY